jgi:hypothetical protein
MTTVNNVNWATSDRPIVSAISAAVGGALGYAGGVEMLARFAGPSRAFLPPRDLAHAVYEIARTYHGILPMPFGWAPAALGLAGLVGAGVGGWIAATRPSERPIPGRGYVLQRDPAAIGRALQVGRGEVPGVHIHPGVQISQREECNHFLIVGGTGAGKTTVLWPILDQIRARGDKMIIFDSKGDFTQSWPGVGERDFVLLSPTDKRSARWQIGADIRTRLEAQTLAETLIPTTEKDPMWSNGARALLVGLISDLQTRAPGRWGFAELAQVVASALTDFQTLKDILAREDPAALHIIGGADAKTKTPSKTAHSFIVNLGAFMSSVISLGVGADDLKDNQTWSVRRWLAGKTPPVAILGFRKSVKGVNQSFISSLIEQVVLQIGDMPDAAPDKRRIWLVLDECPQAGKIPTITDSLTTLRSKGVRVIIGMQSLAQVRESYSKDTATTWAGSCGIQVIGKLGSDEDQAWASKVLGDHEVERFVGQVSMTAGAGAAQRNQSWERVREPVLMPASFAQEFRLIKNWLGQMIGPRLLVIAGGEAAILDWRFPAITKRRPARVAARWIGVGYRRPIWGKEPPKVIEETKEAGGEGKEIEGQGKNEKAQDREGHRTVNEVPRAAMEAAADPVERAADKEGEVVADAAGEHMIDLAIPGMGLVAKITGLAADAVPRGQVHGTGRQKVQEREDEKEQATEDEVEDDDLPG